MKKIAIILFITLVSTFKTYSQGGWSWTQLPNMPFKVSNNAVTSAEINDTTFVYSFLGIDTTKIWSGIHTKAARYNTVTQVWDTIPNVPDSLGGLIAASASTIKNKIIIIGGYHVYASSNEVSAKHVHIYDPLTNMYTRGKDIPVEIDDHVHVTYKDSLIYIISGWTSTIGAGNNTNEVQVYDAINDNWYSATSTPNTATYKVFGASGSIMGDTIYYAGGARFANNFPLVQSLRKGVIDENDPLNIDWTTDTVINNFRPYRAGCVSVDNKSFWIGGSSNSYNYNGLAYSNNAGVTPNNFITEHNNVSNKWDQYLSTTFDIMDLRSMAKVEQNSFIIAGGMLTNQEITNSVFQLTYDTTFISKTDLNDSTLSINSEDINNIKVQISNPFSDHIVVHNSGNSVELNLRNIYGNVVLNKVIHRGENNIKSNHFSSGVYILTIDTPKGTFVEKLIKY